MLLIDALVEEKLAQAAAAGEFDNLPGQGRLLDFDGDRDVLHELRAAYRILKNAGYGPPEVVPLCEIHKIEQRTEDDGERGALWQGWQKLRAAYEQANRRFLPIPPDYQQRLFAQMVNSGARA